MTVRRYVEVDGVVQRRQKSNEALWALCHLVVVAGDFVVLPLLFASSAVRKHV